MSVTGEDISQIKGLIKSKFLKLNVTTSFENAVMHMGNNDEDVALIVNDQDHFVGLLRGQDLVQAFVKKVGKSDSVEEVMLKDPPSVTLQAPIEQVAELMVSQKLICVPVLDGVMIKGVISWNDVQNQLVGQFNSIDNRSKELANQVAYKDDYLGIVSHDIRTPLSVISLCCDYLMSDSSKKSLSSDQLSFVERIRRNSENAANMASDILDVVRLEKGFDLDYSDTDVDKFLGDVLSNLKIIASQKNLDIMVRSEEHISIAMDKNRMVHVLENLVNNAVKFSPSGKKIHISASTEERDGEVYLVLAVEDEGEGIPEEERERIFDKFGQLDTGVAKTLGVGLGLAIAKKFVSLHRGFMEVDGEWQKGAIFKAFIPGAKVITTESEKLTDTPSSGARVLVVEDDESIREYFEEELSRAGFQVVLACDGEDGIHAFFRYKPDLILSDVRMPKVDGLEFLAKVRMTDKNVPFILCTGYYPGLAEDLASSPHQATQILEKPIGADDIVDTVSNLLNTRTEQVS